MTNSRQDAILLIDLMEEEYGIEYLRVILSRIVDQSHIGDLLIIGQADEFLRSMFRKLVNISELSAVDDLLFHRSVDDMPLFINDDKSFIRVIAKWRLTLGR